MTYIRQSWHTQDSRGINKTVMAHIRQSRHVANAALLLAAFLLLRLHAPPKVEYRGTSLIRNRPLP
jgi:hypothetical protein